MLVEAQDAYQARRWSAAYQLAIEALHSGADETACHVLAASAAIQHGDWEQADGHFRLAGTLDLESLRLRIIGLIRQHNWEDARQVCERILELDPNDGLAVQRLASIYSQLNKGDQAIELCERWLNDPKYGVIMHSLLGTIYENRDDSLRAAQHFEAVFAANPQPGDLPVPLEHTLRSLARMLLTKGEPDRAVPYLERAMADSDDPEIPWQLGRAFELMRRDADAVAQWNHALELDSDFVPAMISLGKRAIQQKQPEEGLEWLLKAEKLEPNTNELQYQLSRAYASLGDTEKANSHRIRADELRKKEEIEQLKRQKVRMAPGSLLAQLHRVKDEADVGNWTQAQKMMQELLREYPDDEMFLDMMGRIRAHQSLDGVLP